MSDPFKNLKKFYQLVDDAGEVYAKKNAAFTQCKKGCSACCMDDLAVFSIEADFISSQQADFLKNNKPHAIGACAFLDEQGACRIYETRPFVCRTQGLPLLMTIEESGERVEIIDICELNEPDVPLEEQPDDFFLPTMLYEDALASIQIDYDQGALTRKRLRDLF